MNPGTNKGALIPRPHPGRAEVRRRALTPTRFPDRVLYRDQSWILAWTSSTGLFSPRRHGIEPAATCSACWGGFVCVYRVADRRLLLDRLALNLEGPPPVLFGVLPEPLTAIRREVACGRLSPDHAAGHEELFRRIASLFLHPYSSWRDWNDRSETLSFRTAMAEITQSGRRGPKPWSLTTLFRHLFRRRP